jgi:hypothetical protein
MISTSQDLGLKVMTLQVAAYGGAPCSQQVALRIKEVLNARRLMVSLSDFSILQKCMGKDESIQFLGKKIKLSL